MHYKFGILLAISILCDFMEQTQNVFYPKKWPIFHARLLQNYVRAVSKVAAVPFAVSK